MKTALILLFAISAAFAQTCSLLDVGTYSCSVNHPGHGSHDATFVVGNANTFSYVSDKSSESCSVTGYYSVSGVNDTLTLSSNSSAVDIGCVVDDPNLTIVYFTNCDFNSGCNSFTCVSDSNTSGSTDFDCDLQNDNTNSNDNTQSKTSNTSNTSEDSSSTTTLAVASAAGILATFLLL